MPTYAALTTLPGREPAEALAEALEDLEPEPYGVGAFEIEDGSGLWEVGAYFFDPPDEVALALLAAVHAARDFSVSELPEIDWVAKVRRELHPVEAGRFFVYGAHDADKVPEGRVALLIEAAVAFGTGHHATTLGCLKALDRLATEGFVGRNVADIGCGTAVLAMAAASIWPGTVLASDIDVVAVEVAAANAEANGLGDRLICVEAAGFDNPVITARAPFDLVFANILKGPLVELAPDMGVNVAEGGYVILSGILNQQADDVVAAYEAQGFGVTGRDELGDWTTLVLRK
ncbi:50S ribosomal protein L11 methyltransferase [Haematobacter massiliensis]|uniref:Ribosomal protein L11 methyltransferase n=1 Tax=Haematobacter massiliensis TaxID=195105 RepID=A0A086YAF8_9RHOB|nr:50S ribosomal protein L11 methyltransferase [Haematobacter massiliensis]KFI31258.1 ribosomal protein L11 methyltransferase [Haematobacter massiliensis]OWJ74169.1 50S ribosomal protein L11 methyltransferase [Haematobacter massiliensis]OWJ86996.1 50S ribosomal protein L11 methyltransferase [Haematobacter massiliensis]QBJ23329.1 50S ribosomal protein L11 methyltransferase [Haematobacter massiliensis]